MSASHRAIEWMDANRDLVFDLIRIYLGIALFIRGALFISDSSSLVEILGAGTDVSLLSVALVHYVALAHLGGGLLLTLGLLTRVAALLQVPILIGAVFVVHAGEGLLAAGQSFELATLVLFLLVAIFLHGSGRLSLDYYLFERAQAQEARRMQLNLFDRLPVPEPAPVPVAPVPVAPVPQAMTCTCEPSRDRSHARIRIERRYGMRALRFLTGTTGTPREVVFRCRDCRQVVETTVDPEDLAYYAYW
ncbi:MAG: DoxX family protein [Bacteroidota bacterium]